NPTAAAEMVVPVLRDLLIQISEIGRRVNINLINFVERKHKEVHSLVRAIPNFEAYLNNIEQRLDDISIRLNLSLPRFLQVKSASLMEQTVKIKDPIYLIEANLR